MPPESDNDSFVRNGQAGGPWLPEIRWQVGNGGAPLPLGNEFGIDAVAAGEGA